MDLSVRDAEVWNAEVGVGSRNSPPRWRPEFRDVSTVAIDGGLFLYEDKKNNKKPLKNKENMKRLKNREKSYFQ